MVTLTTCPCCSEPLLHCIRGGESYWFCPACWLDFPERIQAQQPQIATLKSTPQPASTADGASLAVAA